MTSKITWQTHRLSYTPGECEMEALAEGFYRVYDGEEEVLEYPGE